MLSHTPMKLLSAMVLAGLMITVPTRAAEVVGQSKTGRTHLIELFTSEGCSSCPPAEAWMSKLTNQSGIWRDFVPVAFHVDYWDRLGWRDPFANERWTQRQQRYAGSWSASSVYTPGFVLDGREWQRSTLPGASSDAVGVLKLERVGENSFQANFAASAPHSRRLEVQVAQLGFKLASNVTAGENRGRNLSHDFVVLSLTSAPLQEGKAEVHFSDLAKRAGAVAAWITEADGIVPLQATGGWLH